MIDYPMRGDNRWPLLLAVAVVAALSALAWPSATVILTSDTPLYETLGHNLAAGKGFVAPDRIAIAEPMHPGRPIPPPRPLTPSAIRTPGYPFFLAIFYRLGLGARALVAV